VTAALPPPIKPGELALALLRASDVLNGELVTRLEADGWPCITQNQSLVFAYLSPSGTTASELSRRVGITRQSMHKLLESLLIEKLILLRSHPADGRSSLVVLSAKGHRLMAAAQKHLAEMEQQIEDQIGTKQLTQLRQLMGHNWAAMVTGSSSTS
jgi:DNA-binding MarR family transcriptional regulator